MKNYFKALFLFTLVVGEAYAFSVSPTSFDFGSVIVGEKDNRGLFTVTNTSGTVANGCGAVTLSGADADQFEILFDSCSTFSLAVNQTCQIALGAKPTTQGAKSAELNWNCISGQSLNISNIRYSGALTAEIEDGDFAGNHGIWTMQNAGKISFTGNKATLTEDLVDTSLEQEMLSIQGSPGVYLVRFSAQNTSAQASEANILGDYVFIEPYFNGVKEVAVYTDATGANLDLRLYFEGPKGNGSAGLVIDDITILKLEEVGLSVIDGDFEGNHSVWQSPDFSMANFIDGQVLLQSNATKRGEISQIVQSILDLARPSYILASVQATNTAESSGTAQILDRYIDIAPLFAGTKKQAILFDGDPTHAEVTLTGPLAADMLGSVAYDNLVLRELKNPPLKLPKIVSISTGGGGHICALFDNATARCWGNNNVGQLGIGNTQNVGDNDYPRYSPSLASDLGIKKITTGVNHTCAIFSDNSAKCWGSNGSGQLGTAGNLSDRFGDDEILTQIPQLNFGEGVKDIVAGNFITCAILTSNQVKCWGDSSYGRLGLGYIPTTIVDTRHCSGWRRCWTERSTISLLNSRPVDVQALQITSGNEVPTQLSVGNSHTCALFDNGKVRCWGGNYYGQLGLGNNISIGDNEHPNTTPFIDFGTTSSVTKIVSGSDHNCVLFSDGKIKCWGSNRLGQLGMPTFYTIGITQTPAGTAFVYVNGTVVDISAGGNNTCVVLSNGNTRCFGQGGQNGDGTNTTIGDNESPGSMPPLNLGGQVRTIFTHSGYSCALLSSGYLTCFGTNNSGQLGIGNTATVGNTSPALRGGVSQVSGLTPVSAFTASTISGASPLLVDFDASLSRPSITLGRIVSYEWSFGDNTTATEKLVSHIFTNVGSYTVKLKVIDDQGQSQTSFQEVSVIHVASLVAFPSSLGMYIGVTSNATTRLYDTNGTIQYGQITWSTNNPEIATVSNSGIITAVAPGRALITAKYLNILESYPIVVDVFQSNSAVQLFTYPDRFSTQPKLTLYGLTTNVNKSTITSPWSTAATSVLPEHYFSINLGLHPGMNNITFKKFDGQGQLLGTFTQQMRYFDGIGMGLALKPDQYATIKLNEGVVFPNGNFTLSFWLRPLGKYKDEVLLEWPSDSGFGLRILYSNTDLGLRFTFETSIGSITSSLGSITGERGSDTTVDLGKRDWVHLAISYDANLKKIIVYQNGRARSSITHTGDLIYPSDTKSAKIYGEVSALIDELQIYNIVRTDVSIANSLFTPVNTSDPNLWMALSFLKDTQIQSDDLGNVATIILGADEREEVSDGKYRTAAHVIDTKSITASQSTVVGNNQVQFSFPADYFKENFDLRLVAYDDYSLNTRMVGEENGLAFQYHPHAALKNGKPYTASIFPNLSTHDDLTNYHLFKFYDEPTVKVHELLSPSMANFDAKKFEAELSYAGYFYLTKLNNNVVELNYQDNELNLVPYHRSDMRNYYIKTAIVTTNPPYTQQIPYTMNFGGIYHISCDGVTQSLPSQNVITLILAKTGWNFCYVRYQSFDPGYVATDVLSFNVIKE
ncbi:MAG: choice-of-anchor D domain-containing protein [Bdellovibrio sp.]|nr:choice-of-anchor D domain-containing protein [Bdellovibrio sp.]